MLAMRQVTFSDWHYQPLLFKWCSVSKCTLAKKNKTFRYCIMARKIFPWKRNKMFLSEQNSGSSITQKKAFLLFQVRPQCWETGVFSEKHPTFPYFSCDGGHSARKVAGCRCLQSPGRAGSYLGARRWRCCSLWALAAQDTWSDLTSSSCINPGELRLSRGAKHLQPAGKTFLPKLHWQK